MHWLPTVLEFQWKWGHPLCGFVQEKESLDCTHPSSSSESAVAGGVRGLWVCTSRPDLCSPELSLQSSPTSFIPVLLIWCVRCLLLTVTAGSWGLGFCLDILKVPQESQESTPGVLGRAVVSGWEVWIWWVELSLSHLCGKTSFLQWPLSSPILLVFSPNKHFFSFSSNHF